MNQVLKQRERISALADGQLQGSELAATLTSVSADADARESWHVYHLVGDVLRSRELAACGHDPDFLARLNQRLQNEAEARPPAALVQRVHAVPAVARSGGPARVRGSAHPGAAAANESVFRWKLVAGLASLAAVVAVGWSAIGGGAGPSGAQIARTAPAAGAVQAVALVPAEANPDAVPLMIRDARLDELLAAHRQLGGASALQNPSGFLRSATFEGPVR